MITISTIPHLENNCHRDRFDFYWEGVKLCCSNKASDAARELIKRGVHRDTPIKFVINGTETLFGTVGEQADWTVYESDRKGLYKRKWQPFVSGTYEK